MSSRVKVPMNCKNCNAEYLMPKGELTRSINHFCTRSCSAKYNNKNSINLLNGRKKKTKECKSCGNLVFSARTYCSRACWPAKSPALKTIKSNDPNRRETSIDELTLGDVIYPGKKYNRFTRVRVRSKQIHRQTNKPTPCEICGYSIHIQVCHIIPISEWPLTALVKEINAKSNIAYLCPNHHWELDHGLLILPERKS